MYFAYKIVANSEIGTEKISSWTGKTEFVNSRDPV